MSVIDTADVLDQLDRLSDPYDRARFAQVAIADIAAYRDQAAREAYDERDADTRSDPFTFGQRLGLARHEAYTALVRRA